MSSNFDWEWTGNQKRWTEDERKKMQEAFDHFHQSKEWDISSFPVFLNCSRESREVPEFIVPTLIEKNTNFFG